MAEDNEGKTFKDLGLSEQLMEACEKLGWQNPLKIQAEAIPLALEGLCFYELCQYNTGFLFFAVFKYSYVLENSNGQK